MLSKLNRMKEDREQGFTLIELLVVILIIGILAAIAIPMFLNQRKSAVDSSVQSDVSNAAKQVETWIVKQGATQKTIPAIDTNTANWSTAANITGTPLADIKVSDGTRIVVSGNSFAYTVTGTNSGGDKAVAGITYNSQAGGLQK